MATQSASFDLPLTSTSSWKSRSIALILLLAIGGYFWADSRYPALYKKYAQGTHIKATGAITFGTVYAVDRSMPLHQRVWRTSINWLQANEIGMTFGFFFGAAALTLVALLPRRRTQNRYLNALIGAATGAPLGVCANCVVPIARGLFGSGVSIESVLATMFSSPSLNVIVLAMAFALFPLPVVALKLATVAVLIFAVAPLLGGPKFSVASISSPVILPSDESWPKALRSTLLSFAKSFWYVAKIGLPLMLLAALLGAFVIEVLPQSAIPLTVTLGGILLVALVGTFLPVPIAFDVVIAYIAFTKGVPLPYVVTLLCTLGIYSVYSFAVVGKTISWKVAAGVYAAVTTLGVVAGMLAKLIA